MLRSYTISAKVNLAICHVLSFCTICLYLGVLWRLLFGPLPYNFVVFYHYETRITLVSYLTMLSFKMVLKTLFIIDFDRTSTLADKNVIFCLASVTLFSNLILQGIEMIIRNIFGLDHFGRLCFNIYLGKVIIILIKNL